MTYSGNTKSLVVLTNHNAFATVNKILNIAQTHFSLLPVQSWSRVLLVVEITDDPYYHQPNVAMTALNNRYVCSPTIPRR
jgi:hypothetical protein